MRDLTAQVTSSLLQFPEVTVEALGEDEITLDSVLCGKFSGGRSGLAWLACGPQLEVVNSVTGERLSAYRFSGVNEQPPTVRVVKEFSWQKRTGLLVGLEEAEGSVLCLYDLGTSRVVKAVVLPGRVTAIEPISNDGGASVSTRHLHQSLRWLFGVAAVATDVGHVLLVDLCLDDLSCSQNEVEASDLEVVTRIPAEVPQRREAVMREGRHLCFQLRSPSGTAVSTLCYISRSNQLVVGFSDGYLSLWNMKTLKREHHSQLEGGRIPVYAVTFQEPENDPRNCCYLWAVQSTQQSEGDVVSLHLLQLAFGDRKRLASGQVMYEGLEYCDERYSLDLTGGIFPLRGQTSNTKLLSCQTVEKFRNHADREDSVNEVISPDTSVSIFSWQVNTYGLVDVQPSSLTQEEQLEAVLSAAVQTGSLELLTGCIKHWTSEEQPSSAVNLRFVLEWTWNKVICTKDELDQICVPLFDGSCNFIDPQTLQSLQHCQLLLSNLSTVLNCFLTEARELTERGFADLTNKQVVTSLISLYAQVVIWFCRSSLLPEGLDDHMHLSRPFYNYPLIQSYYTGHREKLERLSRGKWDSDCLMIDGMVSQLGEQVEKLWRRDEGGTGKYPPVSLHALLDLYLLESIEESDKHAITIYLLLDIMHSFPNKTETLLVSFPTAFAIPWGLVKLIQGFWLLDHDNYEVSMKQLSYTQIALQSFHHLQRANYIPALQLNQSMKASLTVRVTVLLSVEVSLDVCVVPRPKPLSTATRQANAGNVHTRATFISKVLSKIGEVWLGNEQKTHTSQYDSPRTTESAVSTHLLPSTELPDAFLGTPITKLSQKCSRYSRSDFIFQNGIVYHVHTCACVYAFLVYLGFSLLEARAKVLATSSGFPGFTPQSILRSSLRTTPLATPSASPGRSVTPPLRAKELRISFREENSHAKWTVGVTEDDKALFGASSEHHHGLVEDAWSENRAKPALFTLSNPGDDHAELQESLESIPGDDLEKMDVSKENSNFSVRSDQTTLEYHDAKSPSDFEDDVIFVAAKPANSSTEETVDVQELEKEEENEMVEDKPLQMKQPDPSGRRKEAGFVEESNAECHTLPEHKLVFKAAEAATSGAGNEGETTYLKSEMTSSSEEKAVLVATNPQLTESPEADSESVISIHDSEDMVSTLSENRLEDKCVDLPQEYNPEIAEVEEGPVSNNPPKTEEINVIEDTSEPAPETSPYTDLDPSSDLHYSYENIEQQFACDLPDNKDSECDASEGDGDVFLAQSNFTLVLEGEEGEAEMGDPTSIDASKPDDRTTEEKPVTNLGNTESQEHVTNSVSTVTGDQESQNIAESLPYVPEPIKVAIAENLLDVIKDTRSKEFTSEVVEQSIHETIGKKVTRFQKAKAPLTPVLEVVGEETSRHHYGITPRTRTRGQLGRSPGVLSAGTQQLLKTESPALLGLSPRRSSRRTKEASETPRLQTEESAQEEQIPVTPVTPRRGRKPKLSNLEKTESSHSDAQTLSDSTQPVTPRRGSRKAKEAASEPQEEINEERPLAESSITASFTSRRTKGGKSSAGNPETGKTDTDHKVKTAVSPSRSARKLKSFNLQFTEDTVKDQQVQLSDQLLLPVPSKRGRRRKLSSSEVSEPSDLDVSKSSLPQTEFKLPVTPRRSARKAAQNLLADSEPASSQEDIHSGVKVEVLDTPKRRTRKVPHENPEKVDTHEQTPAEPIEEPTTPRTTVRTGRRGRKRRSMSEETSQGPGGSPLLLEDINPSGHAQTSRALTDRVTRTRSRRTAIHEKLSVEENEAFLFSPPLTKLTKKFEGGKTDHPVQLKDLDPDLSSQFVFSPPLLRSRRKNVASISRIVKEAELPAKEEEDTKSIESGGKQKLKRGRTPKSKLKKASKTTKEVSWSPPPVEIKFISPFGSPVDGTKTKQKETTDAAGKTLRKNKKRLSNFPKPVVRRKML
ncbi:PREDICTED: protein ELYS [Sturnus vulgaris]|uniref:protein ELYS n=1 Tax=Sturnus vulgaris TaxID=9172 RepID=UPI00071A3713|nr:PREDICTED: protein ELYS [Sturnus vulgaris]